jgi:hypothetical protein
MRQLCGGRRRFRGSGIARPTDSNRPARISGMKTLLLIAAVLATALLIYRQIGAEWRRDVPRRNSDDEVPH